MDAVIPGQTRWKVCTFACKALYGKQHDRVMKKVKKKIVPQRSNITKEEAQGFQPTPFSVLGEAGAEEFREPHLFQGQENKWGKNN